MKRLLTFTAAAAMALLASCAAPSSGGRDYWGHRPGPNGFRTVVLDAGHGGRDSGARSRFTGQLEKDAALDMTRRIRRELGGDFRVVMLRDDDRFIDLDDRAALASQKGDVLVSMHFNSGASGAGGPQTFYWRVDSYSLARRIQTEMDAVAPLQSSQPLNRRRIRLTRNPQIPCVLLEGGFLSNARESRLIADPAYRQNLAAAIARGIRAQAAHGDAGAGPLPRPINAPPSRPTDASEW